MSVPERAELVAVINVLISSCLALTEAPEGKALDETTHAPVSQTVILPSTLERLALPVSCLLSLLASVGKAQALTVTSVVLQEVIFALIASTATSISVFLVRILWFDASTTSSLPSTPSLCPRSVSSLALVSTWWVLKISWTSPYLLILYNTNIYYFLNILSINKLI